MKKFKVIDVWVSIVLLILFTALSILEFADIIETDFFIIGYYFVLGGWHVLSMLVHAYGGEWIINVRDARYIYNRVTIIALITLPLGGFWILIFAAPFMAIFYTILCYKETYIKMKRPLDDLK